MKELIKSINNVKVELQKSDIKKSGKNSFAKFNYYELKDFLPTLNKLMSDNGIIDVFTFTNESVMLTLTNGTDQLVYTVRYVDDEQASKQIKGIQWRGSEQTYYRRYLYLLAFGIVEGEVIDSLDNKPSKQVPKKEKQNPQEFIKEEAIKQTKKEIQQAINKAFESTEDRKAQLVIYELVDEKGKPTNKSLEEYNEILASIKKELGV